MNATAFYEQVILAMAQPPLDRHRILAGLHTEAERAYRSALGRLTPEAVQQPLPGTADDRTIAQIVGHIAGWDRFAVMAGGDILAGLHHPRMVTDLSGYRETDGSFPEFATIDDFNAYQAKKYGALAWSELRVVADDLATTLHLLFTHPQLLSAQRLEQTARHQKRLQNGVVLSDLTMGWALWLIMIEHIAVEHANLIEQMD